MDGRGWRRRLGRGRACNVVGGAGRRGRRMEGTGVGGRERERERDRRAEGRVAAVSDTHAGHGSKGKDGRPGREREAQAWRRGRPRLCTDFHPSARSARPRLPPRGETASNPFRPPSTRHSANLPPRSDRPSPPPLRHPCRPPPSPLFAPVPRFFPLLPPSPVEEFIHGSNLGRPVSAKKCTASQDDTASRVPTSRIYIYVCIYIYVYVYVYVHIYTSLHVSVVYGNAAPPIFFSFSPPPPSLPHLPQFRIVNFRMRPVTARVTVKATVTATVTAKDGRTRYASRTCSAAAQEYHPSPLFSFAARCDV